MAVQLQQETLAVVKEAAEKKGCMMCKMTLKSLRADRVLQDYPTNGTSEGKPLYPVEAQRSHIKGMHLDR